VRRKDFERWFREVRRKGVEKRVRKLSGEVSKKYEEAFADAFRRGEESFQRREVIIRVFSEGRKKKVIVLIVSALFSLVQLSLAYCIT
jgi:hypothetical protein